MTRHEGVFAFPPFRLVTAQRLLLENDRPVRLSSRAFDILIALVEHPGRILNKNYLMARAWPDTTVEDVNIRVHISALRRVLGNAPGGHPYLTTIPGRGYRFQGPVTSEFSSSSVNVAPQAKPVTLPPLPARIIGRCEVISRVCAQAQESRLVTLVGPGGVGKTTVAIAVGHQLSEYYADGAYWVDFATIDREESVPAAVCFALGLLNFSPDATPGIAAALRHKRMLLILDSCERVVSGAAQIAERLLRDAPGVHILATSREPLRARGEYLIRVPPLGAPSGALSLTAAQAMEYSAVQLFTERASAIRDGFSLDDANAPIVARICSSLDGIALAIELAAGHLAAFELQELMTLLDRKFQLLAAGRRTALPRHRTMRAALEWSYETLPEQERAVLRRLSILEGGVSVEAVRAIVADEELHDDATVASLGQLVEKSLVATKIDDSGVRYQLLDTTRAYALEKLSEDGELAMMALRQAQYYQRRLRDLGTEWKRGRLDRPADLIEVIANTRAALDWAFSPNGDERVGVSLAAASIPLWLQLSLLGDCRTQVERALAVSDRMGDPEPVIEMRLRAALAISLMYTRGPVGEAESIWSRVLELANNIKETDYQLRALYGLWLYKLLVCQHRAALELTEEFRRVVERAVSIADRQTADRMATLALHFIGDQEAAAIHAKRALAAPVSGDRNYRTARYGTDQRIGPLVFLSRALWLQGYPDQAIQSALVGVEEATKVGHANSMCIALADGACLLSTWVDRIEEARRFAAMLTDYAEKHALGVWRTYSLAVRGRLLMGCEGAAQGAMLLRAALNDLEQTPFDMRAQLYLTWLAETLAKGGRPAEALAAIDDALRRAERTDERWHFPELLRIRGNLLLQANEPSAIEAAKGCFEQSLRWARQQKALSWELRTTTDVARWRLGGMGTADARNMLQSVYDRFSEGFETGDLMIAQGLLAELEK